MPNRELSAWFTRARTLKKRSEETKGFLKTSLNSTGFVSFWFLVNDALMGGFAFPSAGTEPVIFDALTLDQTSGRKTLSTFRTAGLDDRLSGRSRHACTETVPARALEKTWLESTLHFISPSDVLCSGSRPDLSGPVINGRQKRGIVTFLVSANKTFESRF